MFDPETLRLFVDALDGADELVDKLNEDHVDRNGIRVMQDKRLAMLLSIPAGNILAAILEGDLENTIDVMTTQLVTLAALFLTIGESHE